MKIAAFGHVTLNGNWEYLCERPDAPFHKTAVDFDGSKRTDVFRSYPGHRELVEARAPIVSGGCVLQQAN